MEIIIQASAPEPVYEQIVRQIHAGVKAGSLKPGAALPPVRQLANDLDLNRNTVARAYKLLEEQGVIQTAGRRGTFVRDGAVREVKELKAHQAQNMMRRMVERLMGSGLSRKEITTAFEEALHADPARKGMHS